MCKDRRLRLVSILYVITLVSWLVAVYATNGIIFFAAIFVGGWCGLIGGYSFIFIVYEKEIEDLINRLRS